MTIALFSDSYLPTKSGIVTVVMQLREQLIKRGGHKVILVTVETTPEFATNDPLIYRAKSKELKICPGQFISVPKIKPIEKLLRENKVDLIHCHTEFGIGIVGEKIAKRMHIPVICTTHTMWTDFYKYYIPFGRLIPQRTIQRMMIDIYSKFDSLIGVSTKARNYFKQKSMLPEMPSVIVPNAIDETKFNHAHLTKDECKKIRESYGIKDDEVLMLFLGRIAEEKRVFELLTICQNVINKNEKCKVLFVGDGLAFEDMKKKAKNEVEAGKIIFTGFIEWEKVHQFYESADMFITASLSEMHSMTILEAELSSLPIIVRKDESYFDSVIEGVNGYLCDTDQEMEERILELANDKEKRQAFAKASVEHTKKFSMENHIKRTLFVYEEVLKAYPNKIDDIDVMKRMSEAIK